jgi:gas vesicle protein
MDNHSHKDAYEVNHPRHFLAGLLLLVTLLLGSLAGAGAMLLLAPQSGKKTRAQIQRKSRELRDQTVEAVEDMMAQARLNANQFTADVYEQAEGLQQRGQELFDEERERLSTVVEAGKNAVHGKTDGR